MDNDVLRRGKPTVHVQFGEAQAMLAGDAMQALAFEVLTPAADGVAPALQARLCAPAGARGRRTPAWPAARRSTWPASACRSTRAQLRDMHRRKTGALLQASVLMGAACGATDAAPPGRRCRDYGAAHRPGLPGGRRHPRRHQASETLGKTAGKDLDHNKPTYVSRARPRAGARAMRDELREPGACARSRRSGLRRRCAPARRWPTWSSTARTEPIDAMTSLLLESINSPADLRRLSRAELQARWPTSCASSCCRASRKTGGHLSSQPRHGGADDRAALRVRHAARPPRVGRGPPDLSAQDPHRPARPHGARCASSAASAAFRAATRASTTPSAPRIRRPRSRPRSAWRWRPS